MLEVGTAVSLDVQLFITEGPGGTAAKSSTINRKSKIAQEKMAKGTQAESQVHRHVSRLREPDSAEGASDPCWCP